ncbi:hypothetical protein BASA62_005839 [Batrachochytrium salamandrivorans]|nr:hypothetical protein BASA62_005839 [Batrachochytrium salamandrivorans]
MLTLWMPSGLSRRSALTMASGKYRPVHSMPTPTSSKGLQTSNDARFYAISAPFDHELDNKDKPFVVQFSVKFEQNIDCGGGYVKIMPKPFDPKEFDGDTKYNIMFGPDICGKSKRTHVILSHKDENHLITKSIDPGSDQLTHLYTLVLNPDQTYQVFIDLEEKSAGSLSEDWTILPPAKIPDPKAKKPTDWIDDPNMPDPSDVKPDDWDVPEFIEDPAAEKPEDWDDDMDGEWDHPMVNNPDYKSAWLPKLIPNPDYKGAWAAPLLDNPDFVPVDHLHAYKSAFIGFDLWQVKSGTIFDNIIVTDSLEEAKAFAQETYVKDMPAEREAKKKHDDAETEALESLQPDKPKEAEDKPKESEDEPKEDEFEFDDHEEL